MYEIRNIEIVRMHVEDGKTLREIGDHFGISGERIRQILSDRNIVNIRSSNRMRPYPSRARFTKRVSAAITQEQYERLQKHAEAEGITSSIVIRELIFGWLNYYETNRRIDE